MKSGALEPVSEGADVAKPHRKEAVVTRAFETVMTESLARQVVTCAPTESSLASAPAYPAQIAPDTLHRPVLDCIRQDIPCLQIRLHPPELGPLTLGVSLEDKCVRVEMETHNAIALERVRAELASLSASLSRHGFVLAACSVRIAPQSTLPHSRTTDPRRKQSDASSKEKSS